MQATPRLSKSEWISPLHSFSLELEESGSRGGICRDQNLVASQDSDTCPAAPGVPQVGNKLDIFSWLTFNPRGKCPRVRPELTFNPEGENLGPFPQFTFDPEERSSGPFHSPISTTLDLSPPPLDTAQQQDFLDRRGIMMPHYPHILNTPIFQWDNFGYWRVSWHAKLNNQVQQSEQLWKDPNMQIMRIWNFCTTSYNATRYLHPLKPMKGGRWKGSRKL